VKDASFKGAADYERCTKAAEAKIEALKKDLNL
jgi:phosphoglucomutase